MKEFNLELAIQGHPLVTKSGHEVTSFRYFKDVKDAYNCLVEVCNELHIFTDKGGYRDGYSDDRSLFLKDCDWQPKPKEGDKVLVWNNVTDIEHPEERIFIAKSKGTFMVVYSDWEEEYNLGNCFKVTRYNYMKPIPPVELKKEFTEDDLYDIALEILNNKYATNKRLDIIEDWAKDAVKEFKKRKETK